jgi:hypothetical protein
MSDGFLTGLTCLSVTPPHTHRGKLETLQTRQAPSVQGIQLGEHQLGVPGYHEAEALVNVCQRCSDLTRPAGVLDEVRRGRITGRWAIYRCRICQAGWLCWWAAP